MADYEASQAGSTTADTGTIARPDVDSLPAGSMGPASGNAITGAGTITGSTGADTPDASIVEVHGAGGATSGGAGNFQASGQYGVLSMDAQGNYNYVRNPGTPDGVRDVFGYTIADAQGANAASTLTIDIGQVLTANAGIVNLPAGVELSDIHVVGRDLVIDMPDGTHMVIPNGAVFVPQLSIGDVSVPASNVAALLIDSEPQPAAGPPQSSGGNFAAVVPPLDPGVPLGDLIPPTELGYTPPIFEPEGGFIDREPTVVIVTPDNPAGAVNATDSVDESGLPARDGEPEGTLEPQNIETTNGTIVFTAEDGLDSITLNGVAITAVGQEFDGEHGTLTITSIDLDSGEIGYSYTATDNTTDGVDDFEDFSVVVTDSDGDTATGTLHINIEDDEPIARDDTDAVTKGADSTDGNVMSGANTTSGSAGADTVGADDAEVTGVHPGDGSASFTGVTDAGVTVHGEFGDLTLHADGSYTYTLTGNQGPGGEDVFTYQLTDGDGDVSTATLTITVPANSIPVANDATALVDDDGLPGGNHDHAEGDDTQSPDPDSNETTFSGTLSANFGTDGPGTFTFSSDMDGKVVTIGQEQVTYHVVGNVLTAEVSSGARTGTDLFNVTLAADGSYTVHLLDNVLQTDDGTNTENNAFASITFTAQDSNGDTDSGTLTISFDDDIPVANPPTPPTDPEGEPTPIIHGLVDEDDLSVSNGDNVDGNHDHVTGDDEPIDASGDSDPTTTGGAAGSLAALFDAGADAPLTFGLGSTAGLPALTSGGVPVTYSISGDVLTASAGDETVFTLTVNPDGSWSFDLVGALDHPPGDFENNIDLDLGSVIVATDADGDSVPAADGAFIVTVDDDLPTAVIPPVDPEHPNDPPPPLVTGAVDEDDLPEGNHDHLDGDDEPVDPRVGDADPTTTGGDAGSLGALFNAGADLPLTFALSGSETAIQGLEDQNLTSNGHDLVYSVENGVLTAVADLDGDGNIEAGETIFTLTVNSDGSWEFDLEGQLDHPVVGTEDNLLIDFSSVITAVDADGDPATAAPGSFVIDVDDDMPQPFDEENCPVVEVVNDGGSHAEGQFDLPGVGADQPAKFTFGVTDGTAILDSSDNPVTAEGQPLFYFVNDAGVLEAREGGETGDVVFTITLNPDGSFVYDQFIDIDNGGGGLTFDDLTSTSAGNVEFRGVGADDPSTTVDLLLSADDNGTDATVNTDSDSIGSANQSMDVGETVRIDFVSNLSSGAGTPSGFGYDGHVSSNTFTGLIPQVQGSQSETVAFTVWALDSNNPDSTEPDRNPAGGFADASITEITSVTVTDYLTGESTTVDVTGFTEGVFTAVAYGISVSVNADGSVTFSGIQQGDSYGFSTASGDFNAVAVQSEPAGTGGSSEDSFDLGVFSIGVAQAGEPVDFSVPVVLTDADGDPVTCDIDISLNPGTVAPSVTVTVNEAALDLVADDRTGTVNDDLAAGTVVGSNPASGAETTSGDLSAAVTGTGPFTFALAAGEDGHGTFGEMVVNADGTFTYTLTSPVDGTTTDDGANPELGAESFTYQVTDGNGLVTTGTITVNIIDDIPTAHADTNSVDEGGTLTVPAAGVLANDVFGADGHSPSGGVTGVATGSTTTSPVTGNVGTPIAGDYGTLTLYADGHYTYQADANAISDNVTDHFVYTITDGDGDTSTVTLDIDVNDVTLPADNDVVTVNEAALDAFTTGNDLGHGSVTGSNAASPNETVTGQLVIAGVGSDGYTPQSVTTANGIFELNADGSYTYTLTTPVDGTTADNSTNTVNTVETFNYTATDADGNTVNGTIKVNVIDDVPTAHADTNSVDEGGTLTVPATGVLANDVFGADGQSPSGGVTGVATGSTTSSPVTGNVGTEIDGDFGKLTLFADGHYSYVADADTAGGIDHFVYTITDGDGDTSTVTLDITVNNVDRTPTAGTVNAFVDDEGLANGIVGDGDGTGDIDANDGELGAGISSEAVWTGTLQGAGGDAPISFLFAAALDGTTIVGGVGTEAAHWEVSADGMTLEAVGDRGTIFTVHIDDPATGDYTLTLNDNVLHTEGDNTEASVTVDIPYTVKDADTSTATGTIHATFNDDIPTAVSAAAITNVDNGGGDSATAALDGGLGGDGFLVDNFGADGGKVIFTEASITSLEGQALTHNTQALSYVISADGQTLTGYVNVDADTGYDDSVDTTVFTIELQEGGSTNYQVTMFEQLDSLTQVDFDSGAYEHTGGNTAWFGFFDPDVADSPDLLITPVEGGVRSGTINLNGNLFGVSQANSVGTGEAVRIDFVTDLTGDAAGSGGYQTAGNRDHGFDGHYTVNGASASFGSTPGSVVNISAFADADGNTAVGDGSQIDVTGVAISYNGETSAKITIADDDDGDANHSEPEDSDGIVNVTVGGHDFTVTFNADGTVDVGGVTGNSNGTVTTDIAVFTDGEGYNELQFEYVSGTPFLIGNFGVAVQSTDPVDFHVPISVVDGDGDTISSGDLNIHASTPAAGSNLVQQSLMMDSQSADSSNLVSTNDNHRSADHYRVFEDLRVPSVATLAGVIAGAGLAAQPLAAEQMHATHGAFQGAHSGPIMAPGSLAATESSAHEASASSAALDYSHAVADHLMATTHLSAPLQADALHGLAGHAPAPQMHATPLLGGSEGHVVAQHAMFTSAGISIPSAQMLAAHAAPGVAKAAPDAHASVGGAQTNAVVGQVLADSLAGGQAHGPNIDMLLHNVAGLHGHGADALSVLTSQALADVSNGHSGIFAGFASGHGAPIMHVMMMHHDATPAHT